MDAESIDGGSISRTELLNQAFEKHPEILEQMRLKGPVHVVDFADGSSPYELIPSLTEKDLEERDKPVEPDEDCLLYTSPSPRDLSTSRMPSSA